MNELELSRKTVVEIGNMIHMLCMVYSTSRWIDTKAKILDLLLSLGKKVGISTAEREEVRNLIRRAILAVKFNHAGEQATILTKLNEIFTDFFVECVEKGVISGVREIPVYYAEE